MILHGQHRMPNIRKLIGKREHTPGWRMVEWSNLMGMRKIEGNGGGGCGGVNINDGCWLALWCPLPATTACQAGKTATARQRWRRSDRKRASGPQCYCLTSQSLQVTQDTNLGGRSGLHGAKDMSQSPGLGSSGQS
jgi:hypothetical protein